MVKTSTKKSFKGAASKYMTRSQALRKLQLKLSEFRRLCILKGIFPKDPNKFFKGVNKTYYAKRDIKFLANEKLLSKFREIKAYQKKIKKAQKKNQKFDAKHLIENKPTYNLSHIIKERYPRFSDALQDIDDALCLLSIFATLPKYDLLKINSEKVAIAQRLLREFYLYIAITKNLQKGFISIKGIYLTCEINGEQITWLNPFSHPQKITYDIDYEIMNDFLELYVSLMQFVNFKLYKDIGLEYPLPQENSDIPFFGFNSLNIKQLQEKIIEKNNNKDEDNNNIQDINIKSKEYSKIQKNIENTENLKNLFKNLIFYINREVPKEIFETVISSCGGLYGDDSENSAFNENDKKITHYIIDRPPNGIEMKSNKEYIQPQWIFDCINQKKLLPVSNYAPGKKLPPHLSPYYEVNEKGEYIYEIENEEEMKDNNNSDEENENKKSKELSQQDKELREMMLSNNKKKLLQKIREEVLKKKKQKVKITTKNKNKESNEKSK